MLPNCNNSCEKKGNQGDQIKKGLQSLSERSHAMQTAADGINFTATCKEYLLKCKFQKDNKKKMRKIS